MFIMNNYNFNSKSKQNDGFEDDDIFEDSAIMANFDNTFRETSKFSESNMNTSNDLNVSALCCDEELSGYDKLAGRTWIYPTNYPVRDYQFNIIRASILKNTLVSLPTGLGKTFIAAVIMYNFYRWYPLGKIVFTAPTRPLVDQQIKACHSIIAIPPEDTIEMTGQMQVNKRKAHWQNKRVFFATPQVIYNDIISGICPCEQIRCLVIDEAHRATGNYAYCQIVSKLDDKKHRVYRLLALSATPGSKLKDVINVVKNLHIAHLELRTENCIDVAPYSHARKINTVVIKPSKELNTLRDQYVEILDGYARRLKQLNILPTNLGNLSKGRIVMLYKEFQRKEPSARHSQHSYIMKDFTQLISLYHGLEVLLQHGSRVFLNFFDEHSNKFWIQSDDRLTALLERLRDDLGVNPLALDRSTLPDGTIPEIPNDLCFGHPKFDKLKQLMMDHFTKSQHREKDTRAIVFCEYRESVNLVHCLFLQCRPLIKPQMFVGQGASGKDGKVSQKQQLKVMRNFIEGACNVLVATSVGEEGLDVGSVDLIVCFDVPTKSPTRLVQRCGRTGRQREGQVFILVTEGREHQMLIECMRRRDGLNKTILQSKEVDDNLYKSNPRMIPKDFMPQCQKMFITVEKPKEKNDAIEKVKKVQKDLRNMLLGTGRPSTSGKQTNKSTGSLLTEDEFNQLYPDGFNDTTLLPDSKEYWTMDKDSLKQVQEQTESELKLSRWLEWQRQLQKTVNIVHSRDSAILSELLEFADVQRFGTQPDTPNIGIGSQDSPKKVISTPQKLILTPQKLTFMSPAKLKQIKKSKKAAVVKSPAKKDGDIRALFSTATKSTKSYTKVLNDLGINDGSVPTRLMSLFVDLTLDSSNKEKQCYICKNVCECSVLKTFIKPKKPKFLSTLKAPIMPDIDLIDDFHANIILQCAKNIEDDDIFDDAIIDDKPNMNNNFDLELDFLATNDSIQDIDVEPKNQDSSENKNNFDIGDIEDIFYDSSPEEATTKDNKIIKVPEEKNVLSFFGLDSVEDIFADDEIDNTPPEQLTNEKTNKDFKKDLINVLIKPDTIPNEEYPLSPSILSGRTKNLPVPASPIICSQSRKFQLSTNKNVHSSTPLSCRKQLIKEPTYKNTITKPENLKDSVLDVSNQSMLTTTQLLQMINTTEGNVSALQKLNVSNNETKNRSVSPILQSQRSTSPILLTQPKRTVSSVLTQSNRRSSVNLNNSVASQTKRTESIIIYDSDSDSDSTQIYNAKEDVQSKSKEYLVREPLPSPSHSKAPNANKTTNNCKRKLEMDGNSVASPYFSNKKQKLDSQNEKKLMLQNKLKAFFKNDSINYNCVVSNNNFLQKENKNPQFLDDCIKKDDDVKKNNLSMLQMFRRDSKVDINEYLKRTPKISESTQKRKLEFNDSDDEFVTEGKTNGRSQHSVNADKQSSSTIHKVRKKKKYNSFLETEAEISDGSHSGDELSDDSVGSIADFICDDVAGQEDMRAVYLKSIKSPIRAGAFKIPELPKKYNREEILSQYVEEDAYEMDSFCVDSNIELTQVNEVSELELAEIVLEQKRKSKKKVRIICTQEESPDVKAKSKPKRRQIDSDSDED